MYYDVVVKSHTRLDERIIEKRRNGCELYTYLNRISVVVYLLVAGNAVRVDVKVSCRFLLGVAFILPRVSLQFNIVESGAKKLNSNFSTSCD